MAQLRTVRGRAELRGRIVLVDFWTLTCIKLAAHRAYIRAWSQAYGDDAFIVIGANTPEFSFEHDLERVRQATNDIAIDYPVAADNDYAIAAATRNAISCSPPSRLLRMSASSSPRWNNQPLPVSWSW